MTQQEVASSVDRSFGATRLVAANNLRVPDVIVAEAPTDASQKVFDSPLVIIEVLSLHNERSTRSNVLSYASIPSVQQIALFSSTRIEAELLLRQPDGHWPKSLSF